MDSQFFFLKKGSKYQGKIFYQCTLPSRSLSTSPPSLPTGRVPPSTLKPPPPYSAAMASETELQHSIKRRKRERMQSERELLVGSRVEVIQYDSANAMFLFWTLFSLGIRSFFFSYVVD